MRDTAVQQTDEMIQHGAALIEAQTGIWTGSCRSSRLMIARPASA
jgi:hypothetical protein